MTSAATPTAPDRVGPAASAAQAQRKKAAAPAPSNGGGGDHASPVDGADAKTETALSRTDSSPPPAGTREPGRRGKQGETRARLIQVTVELVRREGLPALTTSRITRAAGIAQPGFYAHFKNVDELVQTAVMEVLEEMRGKIGDARRRAFARFEEFADVANMNATRMAYADGLDVLLEDQTFAELFLRYRRDPSLLGGMMRQAHAFVRQDITEDMWRNAQRFGFKPEHYVQVSIWAEQVLGLFLSGAEALLDGRYPNRDQVIDSLTLSSYAIMIANVRAAGLGYLLPPIRRSS
jgi:AcrR family transcriptional regulator